MLQRIITQPYWSFPLFLGYSAYPLLLNLMKEYNDCTETKHVIGNNQLHAARNHIEYTFQRLKACWKILNHTVDVELNLAVNLIYACFIFTWFCEANRVEIQHCVLQE